MPGPSLAAFDALPPDSAARRLAPSCASTRWQRELVDARPYGDLDTLRSASERTVAQLSWDDVLEALAAHPRIGERAAGNDLEARWSRSEQSAAASDDAAVRQRLHDGNVAYEHRFGWVFLVRAAGLAPATVLAALERRLGHDEEVERDEVRGQLAQIVDLRLTKTFDDDPGTAGPTAGGDA